MKETYVKPALFIESFELTQTIALNCGDTHDSTIGQSTHYSYVKCVWDAGGVTLFFTTGICDDGPDSPEDEFEFAGLCYNNPDGGQEIFSSR